MTWRSKDDFGLECVANIHEHLKISEYWEVQCDRGFLWWADEFAQKIWSEMGMFHNSQSIFRLHAETELIRTKGHAEQFELSLAEQMGAATLSSVCHESEKDLYVLHSSAFLSMDNQEWLFRLFLAAVAIQVSEAHVLGHTLAQALGATPAISEHPTHGLRSPSDPVLKAVDHFFIPYGRNPSAWIGKAEEWKYCQWAMERQASKFETDHQSWLRAEFPWAGTDVIKLVVTAEEPHPKFGNGLMLQLKLPVVLEPAAAAHKAMQLNHWERTEWLRCQMLGSWGFDEGQLQYECFVPNTSYHVGILEHLTLSMAIRAQQVTEMYSSLRV